MKRRLITGFSAAVLAASAVIPVTNNLIAASLARAEKVSAATMLKDKSYERKQLK